ncbi:MAG TPA: hypothetical protein DCY13_04520, partial [Verrucomicrobiales bacterium]|nr:hypothetical protein [Verrucomicrobiales bacterium]
YRLSILSDSDQAIPYAFQLLRDTDAIQFTLGSTVTTNHAPATVTHLWKFNGTAGQLLYYDAISGASYSPLVRIYNPTGMILAGFGGNADADTFALPGNGEYLVSVEGRIYEAGADNPFSFALLPVTFTTNALALNTTVTGTMTVPGTRQTWEFTLASPTRVWVDGLTNSAANWPQWWLHRGDETLINQRQLSNSDWANIGDSSLLLSAGTYQLTFWYTSGGTGTYGFRLLDRNAATPVTAGTPFTVTLNPGSRTELMSFDATAGSQFYLQFLGLTAAGGSTPYSRLYRPDGSILAANYANGDYGQFIAPATGTYLLNVEGAPWSLAITQQVSYAFIANPPPTTQPLFAGGTLPDLVVNGVTVTPPSGLQSGQPFTVQWNVRNDGAAAASGSFTDRVLVRNATSSQVILNTTLAYNVGDAGNGPIAPGTQRSRQLALTLPEGVSGAGSFEVVVTADTFNQITEANAGGTAEANNSGTANFNSALAPYPDLEVIDLAASPLPGWAPGTVINMQWAITNSGPRLTATSWVDRVIVRNVSRSQVLLTTNVTHDHDTLGALPSGGRRERQAQFTVPAGANGQGLFEISVETDALAKVVESQDAHNGEANNLATLLLLSAPDLTVTGVQVTAAPSAQSGASLTVQWTLSNDGNAPVTDPFSDRVTVRNLDTSDTLVSTIGSYNPGTPGNGAILPGTTRSRSLVVNLPDGPQAVG